MVRVATSKHKRRRSAKNTPASDAFCSGEASGTPQSKGGLSSFENTMPERSRTVASGIREGPPPWPRRLGCVALAVTRFLLGLWIARDFLVTLGWAVIIVITTWPLYTRSGRLLLRPKTQNARASPVHAANQHGPFGAACPHRRRGWRWGEPFWSGSIAPRRVGCQFQHGWCKCPWSGHRPRSGGALT